mmetsp:Transcript_100097/g.278893  ORF Transcript_100097/g.278893 Transcript_100097/m.278893 type:complete len:217 (+) Transcript_100097:1311-1961(+)
MTPTFTRSTAGSLRTGTSRSARGAAVEWENANSGPGRMHRSFATASRNVRLYSCTHLKTAALEATAATRPDTVRSPRTASGTAPGARPGSRAGRNGHSRARASWARGSGRPASSTSSWASPRATKRTPPASLTGTWPCRRPPASSTGCSTPLMPRRPPASCPRRGRRTLSGWEATTTARGVGGSGTTAFKYPSSIGPPDSRVLPRIKPLSHGSVWC